MSRDYTNLVVRVGFFSVVALMLIVGGLSLQRYQNLYIELSEIVDINNRKIELVGAMRESIRLRELTINEMLSINEIFVNSEKFDKFVALAGMYRIARLELLKLGLTAEEMVIHDKLSNAIRIASPLNFNVAELILEQVSMDEIRAALERALTVRKVAMNLLDDLMNLQRSYALRTVRSAKEDNSSTSVFLMILGFVSVLISIVIATLVGKYVDTRKTEIYEKNQELMLTNKVKAEFLANMTHELRTPLNAIIGYSELLEDEAMDIGLKHSKADLEKISGAGRQLLCMINEVLDMTKIEAGKMQIFKEQTNIANLLSDLEKNVPQTQKSGNSVTFTNSTDIEAIETDSLKLYYMLSHILTNSYKFTQYGLIDFIVANSSDHIRFIIRDNGIGISVRRMENLFEPFVSEYSVYTREHEGAGLGLAITKTYCDMLEGSIQVKSKVGVGTEFRLTLPLVMEAQNTVAYTDAQEVSLRKVG